MLENTGQKENTENGENHSGDRLHHLRIQESTSAIADHDSHGSHRQSASVAPAEDELRAVARQIAYAAIDHAMVDEFEKHPLNVF